MSTDNNRFMANESAIGARLAAGQPALAAVLQVAPGVEVRSTGAMRLNDDWRLPDVTQRTGAAAMTLTLRAAGDLTIGQSLSDGFSASSTPTSSAVLPGAGANFRLIGGADLGAADPRTTASSTAQGDVIIGRAAASPAAQPPAVLVRSSTGQIEAAAARDLRLLNNAVRVYTTGRALSSATLPEFSRLGLAPNQSLRDPAGNAVGPFFTDAGNITLSAGRDVLGSPTRQYVTDWWWRLTGVTAPGAPAAWWSRYDQFQQGIASFGGGDIAVQAGRDVVDLEASTPVAGYSIRAVTGSDGRPLPAAAINVPGGELSVIAGRDIVSGLLFGGGSNARALAGAEIRPAAVTGLGLSHPGLQLFYGNTDWTLQAAGALTLGHLSNPALLAGVVQASGQARLDVITGLDNGASLTVSSTAGDVLWSGRRTALSPPTDPRNTVSDLTRQAPGDLRLLAPAGDVRVTTPILQRPAGDGRLQVLAGGDVALSTVTVGATSPAAGARPQVRITAEAELVRDWTRTTQTEPGLDTGSRDPVRLVAQNGDITLSADLRSARPVRAVASRDLLGTGSAALSVQHQAAGELTLLQAGRDVVLADNSAARVRLSGPGDLLVLAGRDVDLQGAAGLITNGNQDNPRLLPEGGARITVVSGVDWNGADYRAAVAAGLPLKGGGAGLVALEGELWVALQALDAGQALPTVGNSALQAAANQWRALGTAERTQRARQRVGEEAWARGLRDAIRRSEGQPAPAADESAPERALAEARAATAYAALDPARQAEITAALQAQLLGQALQARAGNADTVRGFVAAVYDTWAPETRALRLHDVLFAELRAAGRSAARLPAGAARDAAYQPGYDALAAIYPGSARQSGDIRLSSSQVKTQQGGSIRLITPGGSIDAGALAGSSAKRASDLGVLTTAGGAIEAVVRDNFAVNQSRVFTLARGDLLIWSSTGNIDAGRGAKTVTGAPPPVFTIDKDGNVVVDTSGSFSGSGIAVLDTGSALDLYAPQGEIAAGEAGIASRGTTFIASQVLRGNDFTLSAGAVGAPAKADTGGATAGLSSLGQQASAATARAESGSEEDDPRKRRRQRRSLLLDFLGFGSGA